MLAAALLLDMLYINTVVYAVMYISSSMCRSEHKPALSPFSRNERTLLQGVGVWISC
jgi:hypothetical protein